MTFQLHTSWWVNFKERGHPTTIKRRIKFFYNTTHLSWNLEITYSSILNGTHAIYFVHSMLAKIVCGKTEGIFLLYRLWTKLAGHRKYYLSVPSIAINSIIFPCFLLDNLSSFGVAPKSDPRTEKKSLPCQISGQSRFATRSGRGSRCFWTLRTGIKIQYSFYMYVALHTTF